MKNTKLCQNYDLMPPNDSKETFEAKQILKYKQCADTEDDAQSKTTNTKTTVIKLN